MVGWCSSLLCAVVSSTPHPPLLFPLPRAVPLIGDEDMTRPSVSIELYLLHTKSFPVYSGISEAVLPVDMT